MLMHLRLRVGELRVRNKAGLRVSTIIASMLMLGSLTACSSGTETKTDHAASKTEGTAPRTAASEIEGYPEEWRSSVADARAKASFQLLIPNSALANDQNLTAVFLYPEGTAVVMQFPPADDSAGKVRQDFLEVWESSWTGGDPMKAWNEDLDASPADGKSIVDVSGIPALGVMANSATDADGTNSAFLRLVIDGTNVELSGGASLDNLIEIAKTMIVVTPTPSGSTSG